MNSPRMAAVYVAVSVLAVLSSLAPAWGTPDVKEKAVADEKANKQAQQERVFRSLTDAFSEDSAEEGLQLLGDTSIAVADWRVFFQSYFEKASFSAPLSQFWAFVLSKQDTTTRNQYALLTGYCVMAALGSDLARLDASNQAEMEELPASLGIEMSWLMNILPETLPKQRKELLSDASKAMKGKTANLVPWLQPRTGMRTGSSSLSMQICLVLWAYTDRTPQDQMTVGKMVQVPERVQLFWQRHGIFLFDNGVLDPAQLTSLDSLAQSIPRSLYSIDAFVVDAAYGPNLSSSGLQAPGQVVFLSPIPMDQFTNPAEWATRHGDSVAPLFTIDVAMRLFRAIQESQFSKRPFLASRLNALLQRIQFRKAGYLRQTIPPNVYLERPTELLPLMSYLWFTDSAFTFRVALDYLALRERGPMEALLLLMDVLTDGGNAVLFFKTSPEGIVTASTEPVGRVPIEVSYTPPAEPDGTPGKSIPAVIGPLNQVRTAERVWNFAVNEAGAIGAVAEEGSGF